MVDLSWIVPILLGMNTADPSISFYADLPSFSDFNEFPDFGAYAPVPDDWVVLCGDIRGSTRAIDEGRYKQVNMVGASVITAVLNACAEIQIPFVFGGDGGLAVVPGLARDRAVSALRKLQGFSEEAFGLGLRAAARTTLAMAFFQLPIRARTLTPRIRPTICIVPRRCPQTPIAEP